MKKEPVITYLTEAWRLVKTDDLNVSLEEFREVTKRDGTLASKWMWVGYYGTVHEALKGVLHKGIADEQTESIAALADRLEVWGNILKQAVTNSLTKD